MLGGERHRGHIDVAARHQPPPPLAFGIRLLVDHAQVRSGAMHQQRAQVAIVVARNLPKAALTASGVLSGRNTEPGGKAPSVREHVRVANRGYQGGHGLRPDRFDLHQPSGRFAFLCQGTDLLVLSPDARIKLMQLLEQPEEHLAR